MALVLGLSQCKKNVEQAAQDVASGTVTLTLNVGDNGDGSKYSVNTSTGAVTYSSGDVLYVASEGKYLGTMSYTGGGTFTGSINTPTVGSPIWFFFFGDKKPNESLTKGTSTSCTVTISDQTTSLPVISCAASNENYVDGNTTYSAKLLNKCALVKFSTNVNSVTIEVGGMKTVATVSFAGTVTSGTSGSVSFTTNSSGEGWAILLPQDAVNDATVDADAYSGTCDVPAITNNMFYTTGVSVTMKDLGISISSTQKVRFAPGNLQAVYASANTSTCTWQFASTQYSCIGDAIANTAVGDNLVTTAGTVDLFGWSTAETYYGINNSKDNNDYSGGFVDWGDLTIGEYKPGTWRTLTSAEWAYLFDGRSAIGVETRFAKAYLLGSVHGVILFPDNYTHPEGVAAPTGVNVTGNTSWNANQYNADDWGKMEAAGCVFLPAAGGRYGTDVYTVGDYGCYWSSTSSGSDAGKAYSVDFDSGRLDPQTDGSRCRARSVRLARVVE